MMKEFLCLLSICVSFCVTKCEYIPVLMWQPGFVDGNVAETLPSLTKVSVEQFSDYLTKKFGEKKHVVVFLEENLSPEDFAGLSSEDRYIFSRLRNITSSANVNFLPSVQTPFKALKTLGWKMRSANLKDLDVTFPKADKSILVFKLGDATSDEDRPDFLKRHDTTIGEHYTNIINKYDDVIAIYTGHHSSWIEPYLKPSVRKVRQLLQEGGETTPESEPAFWSQNSTLVYSKRLPVWRNSTTEIPISNVIVLTTSSKANTATLNVRTDSLTMKLTFGKWRGYWNFTQIEIIDSSQQSTVFLPTTEIIAPLSFSYHCAAEIAFKSADSSVVFFGLQVEPFASSNDTFSDAYDCVPFFSAPIWSGIFVTAILAFVMIWALTMIMDIKTMDQFDNPKGKTITISASD